MRAGERVADGPSRDTGATTVPERRSGSAAASAGPRWRLLEGAVIDDSPSRGDLLLVHPERGLALFQLDPRWTPDALARLSRRLESSGFSAAFPGRLPAIHRRLRREDIPEIGTILAEAFSLQPPLTLPGGDAWVEALRRVLVAPAEAGPRDAARAETIEAAMGRVTAPTEPARTEPERPGRASPAPRANDKAAASARLAGSPTTGQPLLIAAGALAAGVLLFLFLVRGPAPPEPVDPQEQTQRLAAATVATRSDATAPPAAADPAVVTPERERNDLPATLAAPAQAVAQGPASTATPPPEPIEEPPAPILDAALAALAREAATARTTARAVQADAAPPAAAPRSGQAAAPPVPAPVTPLAVPDPPAVVGAMILRGEALLAIGDISGARRFFERAAASGNGAAALAMGGTYDPGVLATIGARGITPDRATALVWYRYAASLGDPRAADRIAALEGSR